MGRVREPCLPSRPGPLPWLVLVPMAASILNDPVILSQLQPVEYYKRWMEASFPRRPDGRTIEEARPVQVLPHPVSSADASAMAMVGGTMVITGIKWEVAEAMPHRAAGYHVVNVTLCAGCSPSVRAGPPGDRAQVLSSQMTAVLRRLIPEEDLVVVGQENLLWVLHVDVMVLNDAGDAFTAIWLATMGALKLLRLPELRVDREVGMVYHSPVEGSSERAQNSRSPLPGLECKHVPLPLSLTYLPERDALILDPTDGEEAVLSPAHAALLVDQDNYKHILFMDITNIPEAGTVLSNHLPRYTTYLDTLKGLLAQLEIDE